ncbi:ATP-binding cassette subfamily B protein RaxB [Xanthomonas sacchari]|uniref:peptidase domain-containing ABC transporter n=1 Tax=unclassified Xanthomonas TaxID=2643310 RepID=UPI0013692A29|nr:MULTISPECIES: peptidase domain-containing ABC transporter [unclassified Xanthomonas]MBB6366693.1 ATP-binding cassette subfamily B protein RaxB [Xanthomonas sp. F10]MXV34074.1 peptidase domain-containing ABC transporter [Xanthomonas sp. LMG 8989]
MAEAAWGSVPWRWADWRAASRLPVVMQTEAAECALACLTMVAGYHGHHADLAGMRRRFSTSLKGATLSRVMHIAHSLGFATRALRAEMPYLRDAATPCILHWNLNHFVVLSKVTAKGIEIHDPARGKVRMDMAEAGKHFTGIILELIPGEDFETTKRMKPVPLRFLTGRVSGWKRSLVQVLGLALGIEVLALTLPFQMQWVLDQVLVGSDRNLLLVMTLGFMLVIAIQAGLTLARAWLLSWLGASLSAQWTGNLFSHLMKLPLEYFEKRHMGDVVSRFSSIHSIQATLTGSFVEAMLDGAMGTLALVILCFYSLPLTGFVLGVFAIYVLLRWAMYRTLWRTTEEQLVYGAKQQTVLMESVRGVQAIKLANKQADRSARLANATMEMAGRDLVVQRIALSFGVVSQCLFGLLRASLIACGAYLTMQGRFTAGMVVAFVAYADQFSTKMGGLVDKLVELRMLRLHGERIADIALALPERNATTARSGERVVRPRLAVKDVSFRYAEGEPLVLSGVDMEVEAGASLCIVGTSGCGKSTLAKVMLGLLEPTSGRVEVNGVDIRHHGLNDYRSLIGTVMQDDALFAGSIADNISFFDEAARLEDVVAAARLAQIDAEIEAMPMGYESFVGDMGSSLSGGQKQRILLARALYKKPRILVLDEATSHLDMDCERRINIEIARLEITRIIIAHRPDTIASADRVVTLRGGCVISDRPGEGGVKLEAVRHRSTEISG